MSILACSQDSSLRIGFWKLWALSDKCQVQPTVPVATNLRACSLSNQEAGAANILDLGMFNLISQKLEIQQIQTRFNLEFLLKSKIQDSRSKSQRQSSNDLR